MPTTADECGGTKAEKCKRLLSGPLGFRELPDLAPRRVSLAAIDHSGLSNVLLPYLLRLLLVSGPL